MSQVQNNKSGASPTFEVGDKVLVHFVWWDGHCEVGEITGPYHEFGYPLKIGNRGWLLPPEDLILIPKEATPDQVTALKNLLEAK